MNFDTDPTACLSYGGGEYIYVGSENGVPLCPDTTTTDANYVMIQPLSETSWVDGTAGDATGTLTVNGELGTYVKDPSPRLVVFAALDLFVVLGSADGPGPQAILHSITKVGPFTPAPVVPEVALAGLVGANQGWALDDKALWLTADNGSDWHSVTPPNVNPTDINDVFFVDPLHGWLAVGAAQSQSAAASDVIFRTDDGGLTWKSSRIALAGPDDADYPPAPIGATVTFVDPLHGWLQVPLASNTSHSWAVLYRTADGGATWRKATAPILGTMLFTSPTNGWMVGGVGSIPHLYETTNAGTSWHESTWPGESDDSSSAGRQIFEPQRGVITVQVSNPDGNGGSTTFYGPAADTGKWKSIAALPTQDQVQGVAIVNASTWVVIANPSVYTTTDAGQHWTSALTTPRMGGLSQLTMTNATDGWARVYDISPSCDQSTGRCLDVDLLATHDGGVTWHALAPGSPS